MHNEISTIIDHSLCNGCGLCISVCPSQTISLKKGKAYVTGIHSMECGHCAAVCPAGAIEVTKNSHGATYTNFTYDDSWLPHGKFDAATLANLMSSRRSCRNYSEKPVDPTILKDLITFGISAPSGTNSQQWTFTIIENRQGMIALGDSISDYFDLINRKAERPALRLFSKIFLKDRLGQYYERYYQTIKSGIEDWRQKDIGCLFHGATAAIIVGSRPGASCPQDDALLASQNILLAAHSLGLGSCLIGYAVHAINGSTAIKKQLTLPMDETTYAFIALGTPREKYVRTAKRKPPVIRVANIGSC